MSDRTTSPPSSPALSLQKKLIFAVVAITLVILVVAAAGEIACRVVMWSKHGVPGKSYGIYMADPEIGAVHRPNSYNSNSVINNQGLRNVDDTPESKPAGATRIYCSGGSTTFCYNLNTDQAWPSVLQGELRKEPGHEKDEVLNGGEICFSLNHEFALGRRMIPKLKPDVVILFTGVNEGMQGQQFAAQSPTKLDELLKAEAWGTPSQNLDQARFWKRNSALTRLWDYYGKKLLERRVTADFRSEEIQTPPAGDPAMHPFVMANLEHTLPKYLDFIRQNGATPVVLRFGDNGLQNWYMNYGIRKWRERAVQIAMEHGVAICDVASVIEKRPDRKECFIESGVHVTSLGAQVMADELKKTLLTAIKPKVP